jgi:hypothetical protein
MDSALNSSDEDARNYLNEHRILELLNNLMTQTVYNRPSSPKDFMIEQLQQLKKAKSEKSNYPCIFNDDNIKSVFDIMDPTGRGYITSSQYKEALKTLGIMGQEDRTFPSEQITYDIFLREAKLGLAKSSATVK